MEHLHDLADALGAIDDVHVEVSVPAGEYCTYRVGGPLAVLARVESASALAEIASVVVVRDVETLVIGRGSNLLVADAGFGGLVIHLAGSCASVGIDGTTVVAGAAAELPRVARRTATAGLTGFEWAVGVPGSIGGAVRMNAGGHGSDMAASLRSVEIVDLHLGGLVVRPAGSLGLGYRRSDLNPWEVVVSATLELEPLPTDDGASENDSDREPGSVRGEPLIRQIVAWRREHQPGGANAGSVFTNPGDDSAGRLIDATGLKGTRIGSAHVSEKHANFIQVDAGGSADDVVELMMLIVERVEQEHGVRLQAETRLAGFAPDAVDFLQPQVVQHRVVEDDENWDRS